MSHTRYKEKGPASEEASVAGLYEDTNVAETYCRQRFVHSWSRLLHRRQVEEVNRVIARLQPSLAVELAPGPARLTAELTGIRQGIMIENSAAMLAIARTRLREARLQNIWTARQGNAFDLQSMNLRCDFLLTFRFIRHFYEGDRRRLYHQIHRCLKPGGAFMLDVVNRTMRERIEGEQNKKAPGELSVYDVTYIPSEFEKEMREHGFTVKRLVPVVRHFPLQTWISATLDRRISGVAFPLVRLLETIPSTTPLEWIAWCQRD